MSWIQVLMLLLILSTNGIIIPNSAWYCLIVWAVILFLQGMINIYKKDNEEKKKKIKEILDYGAEI
jgi:hypothetical protein